MKKARLILLGVVLIAFALRFYRLDSNPPGLYVDEQSIGYNAYSILKTGKDEFGKFLPLEFKAFGEYKLPVYIYLTTASIAVFGPTDFAVRFPSAFFGVFTVLVSYFLINSLFPKQESKTLLTSFFLAMSPWHIHFSRGGFEATVALFFIVSGAFLMSVQKRYIRIVGLISFILALYTYNAARIFVPLIVLLYLVKYWQHAEIKRKDVIAYILIATTFFIPFIVGITSGTALIRSSQTTAIVESMRRFPTPYPFLSHFFTLLANVSSYFAPSFLFFSSDGNGRHSVVEMGNLYLFQLPLILVGLIYVIKQKSSFGNKVLWWWVGLAALSASLFRPSPHALRSLFMVIPFEFFTAVGVTTIYDYIKRFSNSGRKIFFFLLSVVVAYSLVLYIHIYWVHYPKIHQLDWGGGYKELFVYIQNVEPQYEHITITNWWGQSYIAALWYLRYDPSRYQARDQTKSLFGKYSFGEHAIVQNGKKSLLVYPPNLDPGGIKINSIRLQNGDVVFDVWEL